MRRICRYLPLFFLLLFCIQFAGAQSSFDLNLGFGAVQAKSTGAGIEGDFSGANSANFLGACKLGSTPTCAPTPKLHGFALGFGGNLMLKKHFGVGIDVLLQPCKEDYGVFPATSTQTAYKDQTRTMFYTFDGIYSPVSSKRYSVRLAGGFGGANTKFYINQTTGTTLTGTSNSSQLLSSANHFQLHGGIGVEIFVSEHMFLRPQFDIHYVPNFNQFGENLVKSEMVWVGYSWGDR